VRGLSVEVFLQDQLQVLFAVEEATGDAQPMSQIQDQHRRVVVAADCRDDSKTLLLAPSVLMPGELLRDPPAPGGLDDPAKPTLKIVWTLFVSNLEPDRCPIVEGHAGQDASLSGQ